jgi:4-amino-4-deoxy-L-arabinose transferase-like glycosyltransferase
MSKVRPIEFILIGLIFLVAFSANLYLHLNTPFWADSARDAIIITRIAESGEISPVQPYTLDTINSNMPILNPQLYYVLLATLQLFIGDIALIVVPALSVALLIVSVYILARFLGGYKVGIFAALALLAAFISNSGIEPDISVAFLTVLSMLTFFKAMQLKSKRWLTVTAVLAGGAIAMKQTGWAFILFIVLAAIVYACWQRKTLFVINLRFGLAAILLAIILHSPVLWYHFSSTGCLVDPWFLPEPLNKIEEGAASIFGIERYEEDLASRQYVTTSGWSASREASASPEGIIDFVNVFNQPDSETPLEGFYLLFLTFGLVFIIKNRNVNLVIVVVSILVLAIIYSTFKPIKAYFPLLPILSTLVLAYGVVLVSNKGSPFLRNSKAIITVVALIVLVFVSGTAIAATASYQYQLNISIDTQPRWAEYQEMGEGIDRHLPPDAIIFTLRTSEASLYLRREAIGLKGSGNVDLYEAFQFGTEEELVTAMKERDINYVFIDTAWIGNPKSWPFYTSNEAVQKLETSTHFRKIFNGNILMLYELITE